MGQLSGKIASKRLESQRLVAEVEAMKGDLTPEQVARAEEITRAGGLLDTLHSEIGNLEKQDAVMDRAVARMAPRLEEHMREHGVYGDSPSPQMSNHFGEGIHCFSKDQKVASLHGSKRVKNGIGESIRARVCGFNQHTHPEIRNAMSTGSDIAGGWMVPDILSGDLIDLARAKSVLVGLGMQTLMCEGSTTSIAKVVGQPTPEVKAEMAAFTAQDFTLSGVTLVPRTVGVYIECSRELVQDSFNFTIMIEDQLSKTLATYVDRYGLVGFGGGSLGLAGDSNIIETAASGSITWAKVATAATTVRVANHNPSGCVLYPTMLDALNDKASGDGVNSAAIWQGPPPSLDKVDLVASTNMTSTKLVIGDFSKYAMGLWSGFQIEVSSTAGDMFQKHAVAIKIVCRIDFVLLDSSAFYRLTGLTVS